MRSTDNYIKYLTNRANNGDFEAQYQLGLEYESGRIIKQDLVLAEKWLKESAKNGNLYAEAAIGVMYMKTGGYQKAFNILLNVAQKGNMNAQSNLATLYMRDIPSIGISKDYEKAAYWLELAADQGEVEAMHNLGILLINGLGIDKDTTRGFELLEKTASQDYTPAQAALGLEYFYGQNTSRDFNKASMWMSKALNNGMNSMVTFLANIYEQGGYGIEQNYETAYHYYEQAYNLIDKTNEAILLAVDSDIAHERIAIEKEESKKYIKAHLEAIKAIISTQNN